MRTQPDRTRWEQRAAKHLGDIRGVLLQGLPNHINQAIHAWQTAIITTKFVPLLPDHPYILDLAAGYGRLSRVIHALRPEASLVGMDFSLTYSRLYANEIGSAVCADLRQLPFAPNSWDGILLVTGLMYLNREESEATVQQVLSELKQQGIALFVDPGAEMMTFLRKLRPSLGNTKTGGNGFSIKEYRRLFQRPGYKIIASGSNTFFTLLLPVCLMFKGIPLLASAIADMAVRLDSFLGGEGLIALHRWVIVRREA